MILSNVGDLATVGVRGWLACWVMTLVEDAQRISVPIVKGTDMSLSTLLQRNAAFATTDARAKGPAIPFIPNQLAYVITCIDPRVEPGEILGVELGDAIVQRVVGGRVTPLVLRDVAYISYLLETKVPEGPWFELAVVHHTDCGSAFLADPELRAGFAARGYDEDELADLPVLDPAASVRADVAKIVSTPQISERIRVSGHVYDVKTGVVTTIVDAAR
jgi:carbonic anhydrase